MAFTFNCFVVMEARRFIILTRLKNSIVWSVHNYMHYMNFETCLVTLSDC